MRRLRKLSYGSAIVVHFIMSIMAFFWPGIVGFFSSVFTLPIPLTLFFILLPFLLWSFVLQLLVKIPREQPDLPRSYTFGVVLLIAGILLAVCFVGFRAQPTLENENDLNGCIQWFSSFLAGIFLGLSILSLSFTRAIHNASA